jgi:glyoxylase-like metal-dependent hydrolase (beta-lactamase superfamily II)
MVSGASVSTVPSTTPRARDTSGLGRRARRPDDAQPLEGGVVLVDTGEQPDGAALREAIAGRPVLALLVTHAQRPAVSARALLAVPCIPGWRTP